MIPIEKTFPTPLGTIRYWIHRTDSHARWLVLLPGLTADHRLFDPQLAQLSSTYNCLTWDAPAHRLSRPFRLEFGMDDLAHWLHDILVGEGVSRPVLIGQSMGGYIAQAYLRLFPDDASGFVSIDSSPLHREFYAGWELAMLKHTQHMYRCIPWPLLKAWAAHGVSATPYGRQLMRQMLTDYERDEYCALAGHGYRIFAQTVETAPAWELRCPALLLCGEKDAAGFTRAYNRRWSQQANLPLLWLKHAGHNANTDAPDEVNRIISDFASALPTP